MEDYEVEYDEFWKDIIENEDGSINLDQLKKELSDFKQLMTNIPKVYMHVTGGAISKVNTKPEAVCQLADEHYSSLMSNDN